MMTQLQDVKLCVLFNRYLDDDTQKLVQEAVQSKEHPNPRVVLQGRDENLGTLRPSEKTILLGTSKEVLMRENKQNQ